jgi:hypothetical protein
MKNRYVRLALLAGAFFLFGYTECGGGGTCYYPQTCYDYYGYAYECGYYYTCY